MSQPIYIVTAYRWGHNNDGGRIYWAGADEDEAIRHAKAAKHGDGGKYGVAVDEWIGDEHRQVEYFRSGGNANATQPEFSLVQELWARVGANVVDLEVPSVQAIVEREKRMVEALCPQAEEPTRPDEGDMIAVPEPSSEGRAAVWMAFVAKTNDALDSLDKFKADVANQLGAINRRLTVLGHPAEEPVSFDSERERAKQVILVILYYAERPCSLDQIHTAAYWAHRRFADTQPGYLSAWPIMRMLRGPGIDKFDLLLGELVAEGKVETKEIDHGGHKGFRFALRGDVELGGLSDGAMDAIAYATAQVSGKGAEQVSRESRQISRAWQAAQHGEEINIYLDSLGDDEYEEYMTQGEDIGRQMDAVADPPDNPTLQELRERAGYSVEEVECVMDWDGGTEERYENDTMCIATNERRALGALYSRPGVVLNENDIRNAEAATRAEAEKAADGT